MLSTTIDRISLSLLPESTQGCLADVLMHAQELSGGYPDFNAWISGKVIPGLRVGDRTIITEYRDGELAGFAILKDDGWEKKLCCLRIQPEFQNGLGLGVRLFQRAFQELDTDKPLLSVAGERLPEFHRIFKYFGFELSQEYLGRYRKNSVEYAFNGLLDLPIEKQHNTRTENFLVT
jgi:hypothetical protein